MAEDLYNEWLGIPVNDRQPGATPNAYDLLAMPRFCHHKSAAEEAARRQLEKLDKYSIHPEAVKRDMASRMMNEVANARLTISDPARYQKYDQQLAAQLGVQVPAEEVAAPPDLIPISEGGMRLDMGEAAATPVDQGDIKPLDKSLLGADAPEIHVETDITAPREKALTDVMPKSVLIGGGVGILLLIIVVIVFLTLPGSETPTDTPGETPPTLTPGARQPGHFTQNTTPEPPKPTGPSSVDEYDRPTLGHDRYVPRASDNATAKIVNGELELKVQSGEDGEVRLKYTPAPLDTPIKKMTALVNLQGEDATLSIAVATGGLRLQLWRTGETITVQAAPGSPPLEGWLNVGASEKKTAITVERTNGKVVWKVNDELAATAPEISPRGIPTVLFTLTCSQGGSAQIDDVTIWR